MTVAVIGLGVASLQFFVFLLCMLPHDDRVIAVTPDIITTFQAWRRRKQEWF